MCAEMNKTRLLETLHAERARWEALLAQVGVERMTVPAINNGWSIKDTVAHVTYYEHWLLSWLEAAVRGKVTVASHRDLLDVDQRNAIVFEEVRQRPLDDVMEESRQVFERLWLLVRLLPEADLIEPHRLERYIVPFWQKSQPLWKCVAENSYEHYQEHMPSIRAWLVKVLPENTLVVV